MRVGCSFMSSCSKKEARLSEVQGLDCVEIVAGAILTPEIQGRVKTC